MAKRTAVQVLVDEAKASYRKAYKAFERPALSVGASLTPLRAGGECFEVDVGSGTHKSVEVLGALKIEQLPRRHKQNRPNEQDRVNVLLSSKDIYFYEKKPLTESRYLAESYVSISYYKNSKSKWNTQLSLKYDYSGRGAQDAHPIFHAQIGDGSLTEQLAALLITPKQQDIQLQQNIYREVRVPTANVIGATALLKLAADHLPYNDFVPVLRNFRTLSFFKSWRCNFRSLDVPDSPRELLSCGWYACK